MRLSIVVPAHNEQDNIIETIDKIEAAVNAEHELIVIDDHSTDSTAELVRRKAGEYTNVRLVENKRDKGFANALKTGFENACAQAVVPVMGDLCDELSTVRRMLDKIDQGYDVVSGSRYMKGGSRLGGSKLKAALSCWGGRTLHYLLGIPTHDIANAFKMYRKDVLNKIVISSKGFEISMEVPLKAYFSGCKITEVPTVWHERTKGKSNFKIFKLLPDYLKLYVWAVYMRLSNKGVKCRCCQ